MVSLAAGALVFPLLLAGDFADLRGARLLRALCLVGAIALAAGALTAGIVDRPRIGAGAAVRAAAGIAGSFFLYLIVVSYVVEIPAGRSGFGAGERRALASAGTYALSRHPGAIWLVFFPALLALACDSLPLLEAAPVWSALNVAYVALQDRLVFPRLFGRGYAAYARRVPFLVPTAESLKRCLATWQAPRRHR